MQYLGNKVSQVNLGNGKKCWDLSSSQYIQNTVNNFEYHLQNKGEKLRDSEKYPWYRNYRPETYVSTELLPANVTYLKSLINVLRWIFDLGISDTTMETYALESIMASRRDGYIK